MAHTELKRDRALSAYAAFRLRAALQTEAAKDLARRAGVSGAAISHVKTGKTGVGPRMARGLARVWGFGSVEALERAAYEWYLHQGEAVEALQATPAIEEAVATVVGLQQASEAEVRAVLADYAGERWRDRDVGWWVTLLLAEIRHDRDRTAGLNRVEEAAAKGRKVIREHNARKKTEREEAARTPSEAPRARKSRPRQQTG